MDEPFFVLPDVDHGDASGLMPTPEPGPWSGPPRYVEGTQVSVPEMAARSDRADIRITVVRAYPEGVEFETEAAALSPDKSPHDLLAESMAESPADNRPPDAVLRFGVQLADGTKATTLHTPVAPLTRPQGHILWRYRDSGYRINGNKINARTRLWLWPLPPSGAFKFLTEWPAFGIEVTSWELDGSRIRSSAQLDQ